MEKLDNYASEYDLEESQDFVTYPIAHDAQHETITKVGGLYGCDPTKVRNQYLDNWYLDYSANNTDYRKASF